MLDLEELTKSDDDQRASARRRVDMRAKLILPDTDERILCFVHDASRSGCSISFKDTHEVPDIITLEIEQFKKQIKGEIVWRKAAKARSIVMRAGVKFLWDDTDQAAQ